MSQMYEKIREDIKKSMREKNDIEKIVLRSLDSIIQLKSKETKQEITDELVADVLVKAIKQRQDSIEAFRKGMREDLVEKENIELEILKRYLPKQLTDEEVTNIIENVITTMNVTSTKEMGKVIGTVLKQTKGKADNKKVSEIVKQKLE